MEAENAALVASATTNRRMGLTPPDDPGAGLKKAREHRIEGQGSPTSLVVVCLKRMLPIGMNLYGAREQELVQQAKMKFQEVSWHGWSSGVRGKSCIASPLQRFLLHTQRCYLTDKSVGSVTRGQEVSLTKVSTEKLVRASWPKYPGG